MTENEYIAATDLAKLRIARAAVADTMPEFWSLHTSPTLWKVDALTYLDNLIAAARSAVVLEEAADA
uniref:Uncharacterized protein n=1 Tax=viral metagenome TaxID=1070528 RepID=A0A6H1Z845_9ZZZZ